VPSEETCCGNIVSDSRILLALLVYSSRTDAAKLSKRQAARGLQNHRGTPIFPRAVLDEFPAYNEYVPNRLGNLTLPHARTRNLWANRARHVPPHDRVA